LKETGSAKRSVLLEEKKKKRLKKKIVFINAFPSFCLISLIQTVDLDGMGWIGIF
jgi:hypothetical protein